MKKLLALTLALMMALTCMTAFADTIYTKVTIDREIAPGILTACGVPEDQMGLVDPILALVNALGVKVITAEDGAQIDLDLNGNDTLSLGFATDDAGITVASTLFPNFVVTVSQETVNQMMEQFASNMPSAGGEGGMDPSAMMETFGGYFSRWFEACAAAGQPGEPVNGEYEFDGYTFDTMVPVTVDMPTITEATKSLMDEMMNDQAAMAAIKSMAQSAAQNSGETFDDANFETSFKAGFDEWMAHFPETVTAEYYCNGEEGIPFYLKGESSWGDEGSMTYNMLFLDENNMNMVLNTSGDEAMECGFAMGDGGMSMYFSMGEVYFGLVFTAEENHIACEFYFMDGEKPLITLDVTTDKGGERTLSMDAAGKSVLAIEDLMNGQGDPQALLGDIMTNGMGALGVLTEQVPEIAGLMSMFSGNAA